MRFATGLPPLRQSVRALGRSPWYAVTVVAVVALTAALSATVFAVVDGVLFKPLPYPDADRLLTASGRRANGRGGAPLRFDEIRAWQRDLPNVPIAGFQWAQDAGTLGDGLVYGSSVVDQYFFDVLGQRPLIGGFAPEHFDEGSAPVAIISHRMWHQKLGGTPDVIGRELPLAGAVDSVGRPVPKPTIVGVLPSGFVFPSGEVVDILRPSALSAEDSAGRNESAAVGLVRLPSAMTSDDLLARLDEATLRAQLPGEPERSALVGASVKTLDDLGITYRRYFRQIAGVGASLVLLAGIAVAALAAGRARQRERQSLVRRALGASSWNLFCASLCEATLVTGAGALAGVIIAPLLLTLTLGLMPVQAPFVKAPAIDVRVVALVVTIAFTMAAVLALASVRSSRRSALSGRTTTGTTNRIRDFGRVLIATQTALAFVLTLGGALGFASLWRAWATDPGYDAAGLVLVEVNMRTANIPSLRPSITRLNDAFGELPGVTSGIFGGRFLRGGYYVATARADADAPEVELQLVQTGGALFEVLGITPIEGRLPSRDELARGDDVAVLSARAAQALWADGTAVGRTLHLARSTTTVVGIVSDPQFVGLTARPNKDGQVYLTKAGGRDTTFVLRTTGSTGAAMAGARSLVAEAGADVDLIRAVTAGEALADSINSRRLSAWLNGGFAFSALLIVGTAILGLVAMATSLRAREFGIRQALGAVRGGLVAMLVREQLVTVGCGLLAGIAIAYWSQGILRGAVPGLAPTEYRLWLVTGVTLLATALAGVLVPAIRSTRVDPAVTLRVD